MTTLTPDELSRLAEYAGEVWNAHADDDDLDDPDADSNVRALARVALEIVERLS